MDELLFLNEKEELCEGSITNLFLEMPDERWLTPPLSAGLLPGILRETLIEDGKAIEQDLTRAELADGFLIGNAVRGLVKAQLV